MGALNWSNCDLHFFSLLPRNWPLHRNHSQSLSEGEQKKKRTAITNWEIFNCDEWMVNQPQKIKAIELNSAHPNIFVCIFFSQFVFKEKEIWIKYIVYNWMVTSIEQKVFLPSFSVYWESWFINNKNKNNEIVSNIFELYDLNSW